MRKPFLREVAATVDAPSDPGSEIEKLRERIAAIEAMKAAELVELIALEKTTVPEAPGAHGQPTAEQLARDLLTGVVEIEAPANPGPQRLHALQLRQYKVLPRALQIAQTRLAVLEAERVQAFLYAQGDAIRAAIRRRAVAMTELRKGNRAWIAMADALDRQVPGARTALPLNYVDGPIFDDGSNDDDEIARFLRAVVAAGVCTPSEVRFHE